LAVGGTRHFLFCRVPYKKHSEKPAALGKDADSGSVRQESQYNCKEKCVRA
jgi:hypothetical protein